MSKKKELLPKLRFPEFVDEGEWEEKILGEICNITNGKANVQDHVENGKYPLFDRSEVIKASNDFIFDCETVIIPGEGMRFIPKYYEGKFNLHQRAYALKDFTCNGQFIYYLMMYRNVLLSQKAVQSTVLSLRLPILQSFPVDIPKNPNEQQKIASCLSSLDEMIAAQGQKLDLLKDHKKGLMQKLFPQEGEKVPKYRFKEFKNNGEWIERKLGEIAHVSKLAGYEFTKHIVYENKGKIIALRGLNIKNNGLELSDVKYIDNSELNKLNRSKLFIDDLMFTYIGTIGEVALIPENDKYYLAPNVSRIRPNKKEIYAKFLLQYFNVPNFKGKEISKYISSSSQPALTMENVRKFSIFLPNLNEQQKIASCLSSLDALITAQTEKIEQLKLHKKGLMQGLFPKIND